MKPDQIIARKPRQQLCMRGFNHLGRSRHPRLPRPFAKPRAQGGPLGLGIGAIGLGAKLGNALAIAAQHRRIDPIQRSARHCAQNPQISLLAHIPFSPQPRYTHATLKHE